MELKELQTFVTAAECRNYSHAAELLNYSQATVTLQIQRLESELDVKLFERSARQAYLTNEGKILYNYACRLLRIRDELSDVLTSPNREMAGDLRIGTMNSVCEKYFPILMKEYHKAYPKVAVSVTTDTPSGLLDMLADNQLDLVCLADEKVRDDRFLITHGREEEVIFCTGAANPIPSDRILTVDELLTYPCVLTEKEGSYRRILERRLSDLNKEIHPQISSDNTSLVMELVLNNYGYTCLPQFLVNDLIKEGRMLPLAVPEIDIRIEYQILQTKNKYLTREMNEFIRFSLKCWS